MRQLLAILFLLLSIVSSALASLADITPSPAGFDQFLVDFIPIAINDHIQPTTLRQVLLSARYLPTIIQYDQYQPEFKLDYDHYMHLFVTPTRVHNGIIYYRHYYHLLKNIGNQYQVQPQYLVALLGVETNYGKTLGTYPVISTLTTLAYVDKRHRFFNSELLATLHMVQDAHVNYREITGSWAGAMGQCQFMPDLYLNYAVAYNRKGHANIWVNPGDALASTANFLHQMGWNNQLGVAFQINVPISFPLNELGPNNPHTIVEWQQLGITSYEHKPFPHWSGPVAIILLNAYPTQAYLVTTNFHVLLRWNASYLYALAVNQIAKKIADSNHLTTPVMPTSPPVQSKPSVIKFSPPLINKQPLNRYVLLTSPLQQVWQRYIHSTALKLTNNETLFP